MPRPLRHRVKADVAGDEIEDAVAGFEAGKGNDFAGMAACIGAKVRGAGRIGERRRHMVGHRKGIGEPGARDIVGGLRRAASRE